MRTSGTDFTTAIAEVERIVGRITPPTKRIVATYDYVDEDGTLLSQVLRYIPKDFRQRRPNGRGGWIWNLEGVRRVPYRLPRLKDADTVVVVEGEKDVQSLEHLGFVATTSAMGAGHWDPDFAEYLVGKLAIVVPDADERGEAHADEVIASLHGKAREIRRVVVPQGKDVTDWIEAGATKETIQAAIDAAAPIVLKRLPVMSDAATIEFLKMGGIGMDGCPPEQNTDRGTERGTDRTSEQDPGHGAEEGADCSAEQSADQGGEQGPVDSAKEDADKTSAGSPKSPALGKIIVSNRQLRDLRRDCISALEDTNKPPHLFVRGGALADIREKAEGHLAVTGLTDVHVRGLLADAASFYAETDGGLRNCPPPLYAAKDLLASRKLAEHFPVLTGITEIPVLRPDGTILDVPGYDASTKLYYVTAPELTIPPIPNEPSRDELKRALEVVDSAMGDFPFVRELDSGLKLVDESGEGTVSASRANAIAAMLTPFVRPAISGPTPLGLIDSPVAGTGKTLLATTIALIAIGHDPALFSAPSEEEEFRKQITSYLREGVGVIVLDNICSAGDLTASPFARSRNGLDSAQLCKALTASVWGDRILGVSQTVLLPVRCLWLATGNNISVGGDLPRRCYWIKLDAKTKNPHLRTGFRHKNLRKWVGKHRGELIAALLTLARSWFAAGKPAGSPAMLGSYESWCEVLSGILDHVGVPGFLRNTPEVNNAVDLDAQQAAAFLQGLYGLFRDARFTSSEVMAALKTEVTASAVRAALPPELSSALRLDEELFVRRLGRWLSSHADRPFGVDQVSLVRDGVSHKVQLWRIATAGADVSRPLGTVEQAILPVM